MSHKTDLTEVSILRSIFILGAPTIATGFLHSAFNVIDMFFVGRLGPKALAAVSISGVVIFLLITVAIGISIGTLSLISRFWGSGHYRSAALVLGQSIYLSVFVSVFFSLAGWYSARPLLFLLGGRGEVLKMAVAYFRIISLGAGSIFLTVCFSSALRAAGNAVTPLIVMGFAVALNTILDPVLIFGLFGIPPLGVPGSALATVISRTFSLLILAALVLGKSFQFNLSGAFNSIRWPLIWRIVKIGFFSSMEMLIRSASALILLRIVAPFGTAALAAYGVGIRLRMTVMMPGIGLGYASGILVGQSLGADRPGRARRTTWFSLMIYEMLLIPIIGLFLIFPRRIVGFFNQDPQVLLIGEKFLVFIAISLLFIAFTVVLGKSLNGAGDTRGPMIITALSLIALCLPLAYAGSRAWGIEGVWAAILIASVVQGLMVTAWFERGKWMDQKRFNAENLKFKETFAVE